MKRKTVTIDIDKELGLKKAMKRNSVWVVEMFDDDEWWATIGMALCRQDGRSELKLWKKKCRHDKFRLRKYTADQAGGE